MMRTIQRTLVCAAAVCAAGLCSAAETGRRTEAFYQTPKGKKAWAAMREEMRVDRAGPFEFATKPTVTRRGDRAQISFTTKGFCDVTVAIEENGGAVAGGNSNAATRPRIVRHLASGVLGANAPAPFKKNSKAQTLVWDGKDDRGVYIDDKDALTVRVSLGLTPRFERNLMWSPKKRIGTQAPTMCATPEGVYVVDGLGVDHIRLFDHDGNYVRTVYPFPAAMVGTSRTDTRVLGMDWFRMPQSGQDRPVKHGFVQGSLLPSGTSYQDSAQKHHGGLGATTMAVRRGRIALLYHHLARLKTDGSSPRQGSGQAGRLPIKGPYVGMVKKLHRTGSWGGQRTLGPSSAAFSPDGKFVYFTGYAYRQVYPNNAGTYHGVYRLDYAKGEKPEVFAGFMTEKDFGTDAKHFAVPTSVDVDAKGRVYVSDFMNDRVQVFAPSGKLIGSLKSPNPARVVVHQKNGEVYVFSWPAQGISNAVHNTMKKKIDWRRYKNRLTRYAPFEKGMKQIAAYPLPPSPRSRSGMVSFGSLMNVIIDSWADTPRLWMIGHKHKVTQAEVSYWGGGTIAREAADKWTGSGVRIFELQAGKWAPVRDFTQDVAKKVVRVNPPDFSRQRMYFNYRNEKLYVAEDSSFGKSFNELLQIDPRTGKFRRVPLPFDAEDMCFDIKGLAYLRTDTLVMRYDSETWREVPWDYGEERPRVYFSSIGGGKFGKAISGLVTPGRRPVCWHQGGMSISPNGYLAVSCVSRAKLRARESGVKSRVGVLEGKPYSPMLYPGRARWQEIHIWNKHGKKVYEDCIPGLTQLGGCEIDNDKNLYVLADSTRAYNGLKFINEMTGTLMKFVPKKGKVVSAGGGAIKLSPSARPKRPPEVIGGSTGTAWVTGAEWMFGGSGWFGFNTARSGGGCDCWHSRFCIDYFARSFVPETDNYTVAVLDKNGNVILRVGKYGNVEDGVPLVKDREMKGYRPLGGDEVGLFHAAYVATHSDRRLFIHDAGNSRIISVKLGYRVNESVALKDVAEKK
jgi:sugar lactone lactonase YvrE